MRDTKGPYCIKNRENVVDKINATFTNFTKHGKQANEGAHVPLQNLLHGLKKYATGATITSSRPSSDCTTRRSTGCLFTGHT